MTNRICQFALIALLMPAAAQAGTYYQEVIADSPVAYWRLGEPGGTAAFDASGNANHGTYFSGTPGALPILGQTGALDPADTDTAADFQGDIGISYVDTPLTINTTDQWSIELWAKWENIGEAKTLIAQRDGTGTGRSLIYQFDGGINDPNEYLSSFIGGVDHFSGAGALPIGSFMHIVLTYDTADTLTWYINGNPTIQYLNVAAEAADGDLLIGAPKDLNAGGFGYSRGVLDEVAVYDYNLSAARILEHYNSRLTAIPEPASLSVLALALTMLRRRR